MERQSKTFGTSAIVILAAMLTLHAPARAQDTKALGLLPATQQNAVVQKYCGGCHSDRLRYGGLSVEHFDGSHVDPTLAAMLLSKITNGHTPADIEAARHDADSMAAILNLMKASAMGAAGQGVPDGNTQVAFAETLAAQAAGAEQWNSGWIETTAPSRTFVANIVRKAPSSARAGITDTYRLILTCRAGTHEGEIKLAWANGVPEEGQPIAVAVDGRAPFTHTVEGGKQQGNGNYGPGATILYVSPTATRPLPAQTLAISNLFPKQTVVFPFDNLNAAVREELSSCFRANDGF